MKAQGRARAALVVGSALLATGVCGVAGGVPALLGGLAAAGVLSGRRWATAPTARITGLWRVANALALAWAAILGMTGAPLLTVGVALVCWLMVHRAWTTTGAADDRVMLLLSMLLVLLGCILTVSPWLALLFAGWAALAPGALLLCHRDAEAEAVRRSASPYRSAPLSRASLPALGFATILLTAFFYTILPRLPSAGALSGLRKPESAAGFSNNVSLGDLSALQDNQGVVLRVELGGPVPATGLYFRGGVLDAFDGARWVQTVRATERMRPFRPPPDALPQRIQQEPLNSSVLFGLGQVISVVGPFGAVERDAGDGLHSDKAPEGLSYTVWSVPVDDDDDALSKAHPDLSEAAQSGPARQAARLGIWTQLPSDLDPRIPALAQQVVADAGSPEDAWGQAKAIERYLRDQFVYTDRIEPEVAGQSLTRFLFETRRGHCEYFGTALAVMLRTLGLPTRLVTGFLGGEWNGVGNYLVLRQEDAHAWVELNLGAAGWVTLDGTPAAEAGVRQAGWLSQAADWASARWYQIVLDYDLNTQLAILQSVGVATPDARANVDGISSRTLGWIAAILTLILAIRRTLAWLAGEGTRRPPPKSRLARAHATARRRVARRGWAIPDTLPPVAAAQWLRAAAGERAAPLETLAWLLYRGRYGGEDEAALLAEARAALSALRALPRG